MSRFAVIGGGLMGAGIAHAFVETGKAICVFEPNEAVRDTVLSRVAETLAMVGKATGLAELVSVTGSLEEAISDAHFVTEAAPERLELKRSIFAELIACAPRECILASNSSVIPITRISEGLETADRMVGTHWWNPPYLIPLVEVIQGAQTSNATMATTMTLLSEIGKSPARVQKDTPGFVANRLQHALWREAIAMVAEGICDAETLDACVKNSFGLRLPVLGPLENADLVGLDLTLDIHKTMIPELDRHALPHALLEAKVADGDLGFKSGSGFRSWTQEEMQNLRKSLADHLVAAQKQRAIR
jgi:3-hydroxybutyryl-CoA dehydrogenase